MDEELKSHKDKTDFDYVLKSLRNKKVKQETLQNCEIMFICKLCRKIYLNLDTYNDHCVECLQQNTRQWENGLHSMNIYQEDYSFMFNQMDKLTNSNVNSSSTESQKVEIKTENLSTSSYDSVNANSSSSSREDKFQCKVCGVECLSEHDCKTHMVEFHEELISVSQYFTPVTRRGVEGGSGDNNSVSKKRAAIAGMVFMNSKVKKLPSVILSSEMNNFIDDDESACLICNMKFCNNRFLRVHLAVQHFGYKRYKCKLCRFVSSDHAECRGHYRASHKNEMDGKKFREMFDQIIFKIAKV